ncbi:MAG TPA: AI-2E family transporter [Acidimicrobiales bacterium]|nr:AI-2E family transporter [Acidimicrobiales bacterium]
MGERIRQAGAVAWAVVGLATLLALLGLVAWYLRVVWPPLVLAGAIVFILNPVVTWEQRHSIPRALGTALAYLALAAAVGIAALLAYPLAADQAEELGDEWPQIRADLEARVDDWAEATRNWPIPIPTWGELEDEFGNNDSDADRDSIAERVEQVRDIGLRIFHVGIIFVLGPIIAFYLLVDLPRLRQVALGLIPERSEQEVLLVASRLNRAIGGFFRGQLAVAAIVGVMVSIGLAIIGLPFWLLVGMVAGLANLVPLIGPWVGGIPGVVIALTTRDVSTAVWVVVVMAVAQQIDNHFISPIVMQRAVKLHPAAVMIALLAGGTLGGFFGLLVAVPTAAVLKIIVGHLWRTYVLGEPLEEVAARSHEEDAKPGVGFVEDVVDT